MVQAVFFWSRCKERVTNVLGLDANIQRFAKRNLKDIKTNS